MLTGPRCERSSRRSTSFRSCIHSCLVTCLLSPHVRGEPSAVIRISILFTRQRRRAQPRESLAGMVHAPRKNMLSFFMLGRNRLPLQLTPVDDGFELSIHCGSGVITENFSSL